MAEPSPRQARKQRPPSIAFDVGDDIQGVSCSEVGAAHALLLVVCLVALSGCIRLGYRAVPAPAADGGSTNQVDAAEHDASPKLDASSTDPSSMHDADASEVADSSSPSPDASATETDAATSDDASTGEDASTSDASSPSPDASTTDAGMTVDSGTACTPSAASDYCTQLPALPAPPKLDGVLDCGPTLIDLPASGWSSSSSGTLPADNHARYAAAWRPDGLYVYVEVDDPLVLPALASDVDPWCGDGVELYADSDGKYVSAPDYDDPGAIQLLATAPAKDSSTALAIDARYHTASEQRRADWSATRHVSVLRSNGYALETFVQAADLDLSSWQLKSGAKVGFDIAINVSVTDASQKVDCGHYLGQYYLRLSRLPCTSDSCRPYSNAAAFCTALLE